MIWEIHLAIFGFATLMFLLAILRPSVIPAAISTVAWGYLALQAGTIEYVDAGATQTFGYTSLAIFYLLLAIGSVLILLIGFASDAMTDEVGVQGGAEVRL